MAQNTVLESTKFLIENPFHVKIDQTALEMAAERFAKEGLKLPVWDAPVFPAENDEVIIDFFSLGNSINFAYTDFKSKKKYEFDLDGVTYRGAFGMWAALKAALNDKIPILDGNYLKSISESDLRGILEKKSAIPMFGERLNIFREVGGILCEKYDGHFYNLVKSAPKRLFCEGKGVVDKLVSDFPCFDDSAVYFGRLVRFDKKAQLTAGKLYARLKGSSLFDVEDVDELTVFADYELPKGLRSLGILKYSESLAQKVDLGIIIDRASREELEIRASTVHASKALADLINQINPYDKVNALHIDYKLWSESRNTKDPHHLTITIDY